MTAGIRGGNTGTEFNSVATLYRLDKTQRQYEYS